MTPAQVLGDTILLLTLLCLFFAGAVAIADWLHRFNAKTFRGWWDDDSEV